MKTLGILAFAVAFQGADAPKTDTLPEVPVEAQLRIREQQVVILRAANEKKDLQMQLQATTEWLKADAEEKKAVEVINKRIGELAKPDGCEKCFVNGSLKWERPNPKNAVAEK